MSQPNKLEADIDPGEVEVNLLAENLSSAKLSSQEQTVKQSQVQDKKKTVPRFATYVFMDLEATASSMPGVPRGEIENWSYFNRLAKSKSPEDYKNHFDCWKKNVAKRWTPTFAEIAFLAVSAEDFEGLIASDNVEIQEMVQRLPDVRQNAFNMDVPERKLQGANNNPNSPYRYFSRVNDRVENEEKGSFQEAWDGDEGIRHWLENLPKPVCLVAHNGFFHDFCVLYCDLRRISASAPDGVYYADTLIGVRNILGRERYWGDIDLENLLGLVDLHWRIFDGKVTDRDTYEAGFHRALTDCRATLEVVSVFGEKMLKYIDDAAVELNMKPPDWTQQRMLNILNDNFLEHERLFVAVKPGRRGVVGEIIELLWQNGFKLIASKQLFLSEEELQTFERDEETAEYYSSVSNHFRTGEVVGMIFQGRNVGYDGRGLLWRAGFHRDRTNIIIHSDTVAQAKREIARWFTVSIHNDKLTYE